MPSSRGIRPSTIEWVDILENRLPGDEGAAAFKPTAQGVEVELELRGFEIKTLRICL
jgi:hypothetical protein